jgi:hypothetical protein
MLELNQTVTVEKRDYTVVEIVNNSKRPNVLSQMEKSGFVQMVFLKGKRTAFKTGYVRKNGKIEIL